MFNRLKQRRRRRAGTASARPHAADWNVSIPAPHGGQPWASATLAWSRVPHSQGEMLRLRAHVDSCLHVPAPDTQSTCAQGGDSDTRFARRRVLTAAVQALTERMPERYRMILTQRRRRAWLDIRASTSPLDAGADALVPAPLRAFVTMAARRDARAHGPRVRVWSGPAGGLRGGRAGLLWLQFDGRDWRGRAWPHKRLSGLSVNASLSRLAEPDRGGEETTGID